MTTSMLASGKARGSGALKLRLSQKTTHLPKFYSAAPAPAPAPTGGNGTAQAKPADDAATQRELFMNVLNANATKRDAKQYLARFKASKDGKSKSPTLRSLQERNARHRNDQDRLDRIGVNLGGLYAPARAIAESPIFTRDEIEEKATSTPHQELHVALVCLRTPESLDDTTLDGVALTLSQLVKLDMRIMIVLDCGNQSDISLKESKDLFATQGERITQSIARPSPEGARVITGAIEIPNTPKQTTSGSSQTSANVGIPSLLLDPLKRSVIPIVPTLAYTAAGQLVKSTASSVMSALSRLISGPQTTLGHGEPAETTTETSLDRIIVLDSVGGIPSKARGDGAHVFINLKQEFDDIENELSEYAARISVAAGHDKAANVYDQHRSNLSMVRDCLEILPSASSALIITPEEAASSSLSRAAEDSTIGAGTRRQKNTLIHNLLTNKPTVSSSLPVARMRSGNGTNGEIPSSDASRSTLVKRGMPLTIIPAADKGLGWETPATGTTTLDLETDPRVDLPRLVHLIEDSFRRKINVRNYLDRIQNRIAGLIIAGEYEGGAILTWEMPPGTNDPARLVPYLDKFAVLSSSQGSSGVADIVFQAMVRTCFPHGVCWRSRKDNPVNKWYFERSDGTWQIPETNWTMFWTGGGVVEDEVRWRDYVGVCRDVQPSWLDGKKPD